MTLKEATDCALKPIPLSQNILFMIVALKTLLATIFLSVQRQKLKPTPNPRSIIFPIEAPLYTVNNNLMHGKERKTEDNDKPSRQEMQKKCKYDNNNVKKAQKHASTSSEN